MFRVFICTVGTSLAENCEISSSKQSKIIAGDGGLYNDVLRDITKAIQKQDSQADRKALSAELKSLFAYQPELTPTDEVLLLYPDNELGKLCAEGLQKAIQAYFGLKEQDIPLERVKGLTVDDFDRFRKEGVRNLFKLIIERMEKAGLTVDNPDYKNTTRFILNPTGGYKAAFPYLTLIGVLYDMEVIYIFEKSDKLLKLPPVPLNYDQNLLKKAQPILEPLHFAAAEGKGCLPIGELEPELQKLYNTLKGQNNFVDVLVEEEANMLAFTALGWLFFQRYIRDYPLAWLKTKLKPEQKAFTLPKDEHHDNDLIRPLLAKLRKSDYVEAFITGSRGNSQEAKGISEVRDKGEVLLNTGNAKGSKFIIKTTGRNRDETRAIAEHLVKEGLLDD